MALKRWRWVLAVVLVGLVAVAAERAMEQPIRIEYFQVTSPSSLVLSVLSGNGSWTRVTSVDETGSEVRITVTATHVPLPNDATGIWTQIDVALRQPLGDRAVIDATDGRVVARHRN